MFNFIYEIFGWVLKLFNSITGNYLVAIMLFALLMKVVFFPLGIKQQKSQRKQAELQPKELAIRKKYNGRTDKNSTDKMNQEIMELYQQEHYSPLSGCLPLLIQIPLIFILYKVIRSPLSYISNYSSEQIKAIKDAVVACKDSLVGLTSSVEQAIAKGASALDQLSLTSILTKADNFEVVRNNLAGGVVIENNIPNFNVLGVDLSNTPDMAVFNVLLLIPILTFVFHFVSMKITRKLAYVQTTQNANSKTSMLFMDIGMPLMSTWITFIVPGAIGLYWLFNTILGIAQSVILKLMYPAPVFTAEDYKNAELALRGKPQKYNVPDRTVPGKTYRSLHHIDDEDDEGEKPPYNPEYDGEGEEKTEENPDAPKVKDDFNRKKKN